MCDSMSNSKNNIRSGMFLFTAALIWGTAFVFQSKGNEYMMPITFNAARSLLGFLALIPLSLIRLRKINKTENSKYSLKKTILGGLFCGIVLTSATIFQQYGVKFTTVGKAGFLTALYIIITPILGIFLKRKCPWSVWIGAIAALIGMYFLCVTDTSSISFGDILVFISAILFSVHILIIDSFSDKSDGVIMSCIQFFVCFIISGVLALIFENPSFEQLSNGIVPIMYAGILSSGVGYTCQIIGQKGFNPTAAALILSLESVISSISGYIAYCMGFLTSDQSLTSLQIVGCVIVFLAVIFVQIPVPELRIHKNRN